MRRILNASTAVLFVLCLVLAAWLWSGGLCKNGHKCAGMAKAIKSGSDADMDPSQGKLFKISK